MQFTSSSLLLLIAVYFGYVTNVVEATFTDCYNLNGRAQQDCLKGFLASNDTSRWAVDSLSSEEERYIKSIFRKVVKDVTDWNNHSRDSQWRKEFFDRKARREVRAPPYSHFRRYFTNVLKLKNERLTPRGRSKYDIIALIHGDVSRIAHDTPNFLLWHSLYLRIFEAAIDCPIPYWDSTLDAEMEDPRRSVMWSPRYFGNVGGLVETGPFASFPTPFGPLLREGGSPDSNSLMRQSNVNRLFERRRYIDITSPRARFPFNLEFLHNGPHVWVGGQMARVESSTFDPLFFCHHAFVDYLWKEFRINQQRMGVNPFTENVNLNRNTPVVGLPSFFNNDGLSKILYDLSMYLSRPTCSNKCAGADNNDMYCDDVKKLCVSKEHDIAVVPMAKMSHSDVEVMKAEMSVLSKFEQFHPVFINNG